MPSPLTLHPTRVTASPAGRRRTAGALVLTSATLLIAGLALGSASPASAAEATVGLGTAESFAVLGGTAVTNTGPSVISGDLGVAPQTAITGFPPGRVINGVIHQTDAVAGEAQDDLTTAYNDAAGRSVTEDVTGTDLGGRRLVSGVYRHTTGMQLTGTVTLDGQGDPNAVFIFQAGSTLTTASDSTVALINGASACNVFWQVSSSATLGTRTDFVGTIMALTSATLTTGADVEGRVLARNGAVSLDTNDITASACAAATVPTTTPTTVPTTAPSESASASASPSTSPTDEPSATVEPSTVPSGSGGGGGGNGGGGGDGGGGGGPNEPTVPFGHPETGLAAGSASVGPFVLYGLAALAMLGACVAFGRALRPARAGR